MKTLIPVLIVIAATAVAGIALGIIAGFMQRTFFSRFDRICRVLPGLDCGACGYATCNDYAEAIASGKCGLSRCAPGGPRTAHDAADIMHTEVNPGEKRIAAVHCKGGIKYSEQRARYEGIDDCRAALLIGNGTKACVEGCLGLGTCVRTCPFGALSITSSGIAAVDRTRCTGCGVCLDTCPRNLLSLIPEVHKIFLACSNHDEGADVVSYCAVSCTACGQCVAITPSGAITMQGNLPHLDYLTPGENFIAAAYRCPSKCFVDDVKARPRANIGTTCNGCGKCLEICPISGAISGAPGGRHVVKKELCIGCGRCLAVCDRHAISLWGSLGYDGGKTARFIAGIHG